MTIELTHTFVTITPTCCNATFAVPEQVYETWRRLKERGSWWCPSCGSCRHFLGETKEARRIRELEQRLARTQSRAVHAESEARARARQYNRMRDRVKNGVCPCCNRTFQNLARHMKTKHPEFGARGRFKALRLAFGLTQGEVAEEIGLSATTISHYENGAHVSKETDNLIDGWIGEAQQS